MQEINLVAEDDKKKLILNRIIRQFASSNVNVLIGSGFSRPILDTLNNIEKDLTKAMELGDSEKEYIKKKEFFEKCIYPLVNVDQNDNVFDDKVGFIKLLCDIISSRDTSTVRKLLNIFTTNYDNIIEICLEKIAVDYIDGFIGRVHPIFSTSNYGRIFSKLTDTTGRISELISANLYKLHGSLYWNQEDNSKIVFEDFRKRLKEISVALNKEEFLLKYNENLAIVNPTKDKFNTTLLNNNYYDQLRMFSNELSKQNSVLIAYGFSFADEHLLQILQRALSSNPTLILLLFPYSEDDLDNYKTIFRFHNNVIAYYQRKEINNYISFDLKELNTLLQEIYNGIK